MNRDLHSITFLRDNYGKDSKFCYSDILNILRHFHSSGIATRVIFSLNHVESTRTYLVVSFRTKYSRVDSLLKIWRDMIHLSLQIFKGCIPQVLLVPFLIRFSSPCKHLGISSNFLDGSLASAIKAFFWRSMFLVFVFCFCFRFYFKYETLCLIWYHLYNLENVKNTDFCIKSSVFHGCFLHFLNLTSLTKWRKASHSWRILIVWKHF